MKKYFLQMMTVLFLVASISICLGAEKKEGKFAEITMNDVKEIMNVQYIVKSYPWMIPEGYTPKFAYPQDLVLTKEQEEKIKSMHLTGAFIWFGDDIAYKIGKQAVSRVFDPLGVKWTEHVSSTVDEQIKALEACEAQAKAGKLDFFIIEALVDETVEKAIWNVIHAGAKIALWGTGPSSIKAGTDYYLGTNIFSPKAEAIQGMLLINKMLRGKGNVALVEMGPHHTIVDMREEAAEDFFNYYPGLKLVDKIEFIDPRKVEALVSGMLRRHPEIDAIWVTFMDPPAIQTNMAVTELGLQDKIRIVPLDLAGEIGAKYLVRDDDAITCIASTDYYDSTLSMVRMVLKHYAGEHYDFSQAISRPVIPANLRQVYDLECGGWKLPAEIDKALKAKGY